MPSKDQVVWLAQRCAKTTITRAPCLLRISWRKRGQICEPQGGLGRWSSALEGCHGRAPDVLAVDVELFERVDECAVEIEFTE